MSLHGLLTGVAQKYDRRAPMDSEGQILLRNSRASLAKYVPGGILVEGSGGKGIGTLTPWIGLFDPEETSSPLSGIYLVYLFSEDISTVTLSLNQGVTQLINELGHARAIERLAEDAALVRNEMGPNKTNGTVDVIDLKSRGRLQRAYVAGNIAALEYDLATIPSDRQLAQDLGRFLNLYSVAIDAKRRLLLARPGSIASSSAPQLTSETNPLDEFKPKSDAEYVAEITGQRMVKSRRHETLVRQYGEWARSTGWSCSTTRHPIDLVISRSGTEYMVEAECLHSGRAASAVREAIGQLFEYSHFLDKEGKQRLLALFSEPVGDAFVNYLGSHGIDSVWRVDGRWVGTAAGTCDAVSEPSFPG